MPFPINIIENDEKQEHEFNKMSVCGGVGKMRELSDRMKKPFNQINATKIIFAQDLRIFTISYPFIEIEGEN